MRISDVAISVVRRAIILKFPEVYQFSYSLQELEIERIKHRSFKIAR